MRYWSPNNRVISEGQFWREGCRLTFACSGRAEQRRRPLLAWSPRAAELGRSSLYDPLQAGIKWAGVSGYSNKLKVRLSIRRVAAFPVFGPPRTEGATSKL